MTEIRVETSEVAQLVESFVSDATVAEQMRLVGVAGSSPADEALRTLKERSDLMVAIGFLSALADTDCTLLNERTRQSLRVVLAEVERLRREAEESER